MRILEDFSHSLKLKAGALGIVTTAVLWPIAGFAFAASFLFGHLIGILNSALLVQRILSIQDKDEKRAKKIMRSGMIVRFLMVILAVSSASYLWRDFNIIAFLIGFFILQVLAVIDTYKETLERER